MMFRRLNICFLLLLSLVVACGTGIGNPYSNASRDPLSPANDYEGVSGAPKVLAFDIPRTEYEQDVSPAQENGKECGEFTEKNTQEEVDEGRACIRIALTSCHVARYFIDQTTASGHFVAYVSVRQAVAGGCEIYRHTVSSNQSLFYGEAVKSCQSLDENTIPELACPGNN